MNSYITKNSFKGYEDYKSLSILLSGSCCDTIDFFYHIKKYLCEEDLKRNKKIIDQNLLFPWKKDDVFFCYVGFRYFLELEKQNYFKYQLYDDIECLCGLAHFQNKKKLKIENNVIKVTKNFFIKKKENNEKIKKEKISILKNLHEGALINNKQINELIKKMNLLNKKGFIDFNLFEKNFLYYSSLYLKSQLKKIFKKKNKIPPINFRNNFWL